MSINFAISLHVDAQDVASRFSVIDQVKQIAFDTCALEAEIERPVNLFQPGQGKALYRLTYTRSGDLCYLTLKQKRLPAPQYYPAIGASNHHDASGNLQLWMESARAFVMEEDHSDEYYEGISFDVARDGTILDERPGSVLERRRSSDSNTISLNLLRRIYWALGRPPGDNFGETISQVEDPDGMTRLRVPGSWVPPGAGFGSICDMVVDPANGFLVRKSQCGAEGEPPREESKSEGVRRFGDVFLAERGEFTMHPIETMTVRLISFSPEFDPELVTEARKIIARAETRPVRVFDHREDLYESKNSYHPAGTFRFDD